MTAREPSELLPLSPPVFNIMLVLGSEVLHGYGIMQELERRTGGRETLLPGSLYATIARMVGEGLIEEVAKRGESDRRRRFYRLTRFGRVVARAEAARMARLLEQARDQDLLPGTL
jgi:DNA-binding PadR family transcriptional regulator